ncbi:caf1 family ribonuclease [Colletotrichum kahawae]|uniref:Caf1 family ribonuclease n=1 Tax=Colletotrichum kahawae TaxID=34407 RepID=A0AAD9Y579_COLKA|nr:caf1 family ribonuclease [Colletotrichum kahawae]
MEVTMENFWRQLPRILISIAESNFVTIDVEMTGIADKMSENFWKKTNQTRQGIYETGKRIASTYNVFELGLTCVKPDGDDSYKTESYSFYVSPLLLEDTREDSFFAKDLGRNLTASLSTLKFMRKEGLQLEKIFDNPVPYLSRKESRDATERLESRAQTQPIKDHPYDEDEEGLNFFSTYVFDEIMSWLDDRNDDRKSEIEIRIPYSDSKKRSSVYHKIVRVTAQNMVPHMKCRTWNHGLAVIISPEDSDENQERQQTFQDNLSASIRKQTGLRLIMEALSGGHFADIIDPSYIIEALSSWPGGMTVQGFCQEVQQKFGDAPLLSPEQESGEYSEGVVSTTPEQESSYSSEQSLNNIGQSLEAARGHQPWRIPESSSEWMTSFPQTPRHSEDDISEATLSDQIRAALWTLESKLQLQRPPIVGHNQFFDLLFIYQTFFDDLPASCGEFFASIYELFPHIIDTKLMAIADQAIEGEDPLADIFDRFIDDVSRPFIGWDPVHGYSRRANAHEAGYDSFMTAVIFLRLAHKLARKALADNANDAQSWDKKMRRLYNKGWLLEIGRDPDCFGSDSGSDFAESTASSDDDDEEVGELYWGHHVFDMFRNTLRIGPSTNVFLEAQWAADRAFRRVPRPKSDTEGGSISS